jgi:hypothetical protein
LNRSFKEASASEAAKCACGGSEDDLVRRTAFLPNQTRLIVALDGPESLRCQPEYLRFKAAHDAAFARLGSGQTLEAVEAARRAMAPWERPLWMTINRVTILMQSGVCAETINVEVSGAVQVTAMLLSRAGTSCFVTLFGRSSIYGGGPTSVRESRNEALERYVRDGANA